MDFLDPRKKRAHRIRLFVGYGLMAIAIVTATIILAYVTGGYGYDRKTNSVTQNGLVFVGAHPQAATIYLNDKERGSTDGRFVLEEGDYTLELKRNGYRPWKRDFTLEPVAVERFVYPFMFPEKLQSKDVLPYATTPALVTESPDRHWIVTHQTAVFNEFQVIDTSTDENLSRTVVVPNTILVPRPGSQSVELVEWSTDNRHVLLKHVYTGGVDYVVLDRENGAASVNVTAALGQQYTEIALRDKRVDRFYVLDGAGTLQSVELKSKQFTAVASQVKAFFPYSDDDVLYVTTEGAEPNKTLVRMRQDNNIYVLRSLPLEQKYLLSMAEFDRKLYVGIGSSTEKQLYLYQDPIGYLRKGSYITPPVKALLRVESPGEYVSFSANARFITVQGGNSFAVYDMEDNRQYRYALDLKLPPAAKATWMDGHRLNVVAQNSKLYVFDFDGTNRQELVTSSPIKPMFDRDYTALFTLSPSVSVANKTAIVRTELIVEQ